MLANRTIPTFSLAAQSAQKAHRLQKSVRFFLLLPARNGCNFGGDVVQ